MVEVKTKEQIPSRCGIDCKECKFQKENGCLGCSNISKPFWGEKCPVKSCCEGKNLLCCGECDEFPCELLTSFAYDKEQGDHGLRIENCKNWCQNRETV